MAYNDLAEVVLSKHAQQLWKRRDVELTQWVQRSKPKRKNKQIVVLGNEHIDAEIFGALTALRKAGIRTEYSCAGVSVLDEPEDHSLYAYVTIIYSEQAEKFVSHAMELMRHRLLVAFEPARNRYDLSSFYIGHNRTFCMLLEHCARSFIQQEQP